MAFHKLSLLIGVVCLISLHGAAHASDPDPVKDFNLPGYNSSHPPPPSAFKFSGLAGIPDGPVASSGPLEGLALGLADVNTFPGLSSLGVSYAIVKVGRGKSVPAHTHPRATELLYVLRGKFEVGFVDTAGNVFKTTVSVGEVFVFPRGLLHFQSNVGHHTAVFLAALNSENPGTQLINPSLGALGAPRR